MAITFDSNTGSITGPNLNFNGVTFDTSGRLLAPNTPSFAAHYTNAATNLAGSAGNGYVVYNATAHNTGGYYNTTNGRFTAPVTGVYQFSWTGIKSDSGGSMAGNVSRLNLHKNGSAAAGTVELRLDSGDDYNYGCATHIVYLTAGDYVQIYKSDVGGLHPGWASFSGYLIG